MHFYKSAFLIRKRRKNKHPIISKYIIHILLFFICNPVHVFTDFMLKLLTKHYIIRHKIFMEIKNRTEPWFSVFGSRFEPNRGIFSVRGSRFEPLYSYYYLTNTLKFIFWPVIWLISCMLYSSLLFISDIMCTSISYLNHVVHALSFPSWIYTCIFK